MNHIEFQRWISKRMGNASAETEMNVLNSCPVEAFYGGPAMSLCGSRWVGFYSNPEGLIFSTINT